MTDILDVVNKLGGASFATLLSLILWSGYRDYWCWSKDRDRAIEALRADREDWKRTALQALGGFEKSSDYAVRIAAVSPPIGLATLGGRAPARESPPNGSER